MPKDNSQSLITNTQTVTPVTDDMPPLVMEETTPPMLSTSGLPVVEEEKKETDSGSAAPSDDIVMAPVITTQKKKFAGGKVIATILGLFLLVGGLGAGILLVGQQQDIRERAGCYSTCMNQIGDTDECDYACQESGQSGDDSGYPDNPGCGCGVNAQGECKDCGSGVDDGGNTDGGGSGTSDTTCSTTNAIMGYCPPPSSGNGCISTGCSTGQTCHCQGGQSCDYGVCVDSTTFNNACTGDGRQVSTNSDNPTAYTCCEAGYINNPNGDGCVQATGGGGGGTPPEGNPTPTPPAITAVCQNVKAYSSTWAPLTYAQQTQLKAGDSVNFCVTGSATGGSFDKAKFTINGAVQAETTLVRPSSTDFCQSYVIPAGTTIFNVSAQINHVTLGWK